MSRTVLVMASVLLMAGGWQLQQVSADHAVLSLAEPVIGEELPQPSPAPYQPPVVLPEVAPELANLGMTIPWIEELPVIANAVAAEQALSWWRRQEHAGITGFQQLHHETLAGGGTLAASVAGADGLVVSFTSGGRLLGWCTFSSTGDLCSSHVGDEDGDRPGTGVPPSAEDMEHLAQACRRLSQADATAVHMLQVRPDWPSDVTAWKPVCGSWRYEARSTEYHEATAHGGRSGGKTVAISIGTDGVLLQCLWGGWGRISCGSRCGSRTPSSADPDGSEPPVPAANN